MIRTVTNAHLARLTSVRLRRDGGRDGPRETRNVSDRGGPHYTGQDAAAE